MHKYFIKTPWWVQKIFPFYIWKMKTDEKVVYLTFDDGPHPTITPWVLNELRQHHARATFFCIGKNVLSYPETHMQLLDEGHAVGNHTHHHLNGWKTSNEKYLEDVGTASMHIHSHLFRPPYGRIKASQAKGLSTAMNGNVKVIMWDVLSADFDKSITKEQCLNNVLKGVQPGSIVVFHDSEKAFHHLEYALPKVLSALKNEGYRFREIRM